MDSEVNIAELAALLKARRGTRGLRAVAEEIGSVSASTLSRVEQGKLPDLDTFIRICRWLGVSPGRFIPGMEDTPDDSAATVPPQTKRAIITAHLRTDRTLDPKTAEALVQMIELAYSALARGELGAQAGE
jgi:transcriptional regulator with XRE-family HTH domain